jgi:hypothetical protein
LWTGRLSFFGFQAGAILLLNVPGGATALRLQLTDFRGNRQDISALILRLRLSLEQIRFELVV